MDTSPSKEVKAPQHAGTPRSHLRLVGHGLVQFFGQDRELLREVLDEGVHFGELRICCL